MRCLAAGYEERRRRRRRCCGGVLASVAANVDDGRLHDGARRRRRLRPIARPVKVPEPTQDEATGVPAARAQRERELHHGQRTARRSDPTQRLQVYGAGTQLQCGYRVQRRRRHRR